MGRAKLGAAILAGLGAAGSGYVDAEKQKQELKMLLAQRALEQQKLNEEVRNHQDELRLKALQDTRSQAVIGMDANGKPTETRYDGIAPATLNSALPWLNLPSNMIPGVSKVSNAPVPEPQYLNQTVGDNGVVTHQELLPRGVRPGTTSSAKAQPKAVEANMGHIATLNQLESMLKDVDSGIPGVVQKYAGKLTGGAVGGAAAKVYNDALEANAVELYRASSGDTKISNTDVPRAAKELPSPYDSLEVRKLKIDNMREKIMYRMEHPDKIPAAGDKVNPVVPPPATDEHTDARKWALLNPNDPRAKKILAVAGGQ